MYLSSSPSFSFFLRSLPLRSFFIGAGKAPPSSLLLLFSQKYLNYFSRAQVVLHLLSPSSSLLEVPQFLQLIFIEPLSECLAP